MASVWMYAVIVAGGVLQTCGAAMNGQLNESLQNRWLACLVSFVPIVALFVVLFVTAPMPLPDRSRLAAMPWWAPLGGLVGALQVFAGLTLVRRVGAGPFVGLTVTAALIGSLVIDHFGLLRMPVQPAGPLRLLGAMLLVAGIALITRR